MKTIYKYPLLIQDCQSLQLPANAEILTVQLQDNTPCIWALVDNNLPLSDVIIRMFPTGAYIDDSLNLKYCGTIQLMKGNMVIHFFIEIERNE